MKKSFFVLLSAVILLFTACDSFMSDDGFYSDIENDVKVANAEQIKVYVRYAMTRQGKTDPDGTATFKVGIPQEISATTEPEYGFVRWAAFTTKFLATGDNQSKNKDFIYIDKDDYNTRLKPYELKSSVVSFENAKNPTTNVTINQSRSDIFLVPVVAKRPSVALTIPAIGSKDVVRNMSVRISFSNAMDPASFKNDAGEYDKITITQGSITTTADGDIEIASEDISELFEKPKFSKNQKMITLQFKQEALATGYTGGASVYVNISKEVKDVNGFAMVDDEKVSFTAGNSMDSLAPRIRALAGGKDERFADFKGMIKESGQNINTYTEFQYTGKEGPVEATSQASGTGVYNAFYNAAKDKIVANRVKDKVIIYADAEDIAGSGSGASQSGIDTDVAALSIRAKRLYNSDGTPVADYEPEQSSVGYAPQVNRTSLEGSFKALVLQANDSVEDKFKLDPIHGCLFEYDMTGMPDGLYRIDVAAVDMIGNTGFGPGGDYAEEYGNSYASIYVVRDSTPPEVSSSITPDLSSKRNDYFNAETYRQISVAKDINRIKDPGNELLSSSHSNLKWVFTPNADSEKKWLEELADSRWKNINNDYIVDESDIPSVDGEVSLTLALMDDLGNTSAPITVTKINYDNTVPLIKDSLSWTPGTGYAAGIAKENELKYQTLTIPVKEQTSGIKSIVLLISKDGDTEYYEKPFNGSNLTVVSKGTLVPDSSYAIDQTDPRKLTFNSTYTNFDSNITISGIYISDADTAEEREGEYTVMAQIIDAAGNISTVENVNQTPVILSIDSTPPEVELSVPDIKKAVRFFSSDTAEYWIDANSSNLNTSSSIPVLKKIYVTVKENNSGIKIFDFTDSTLSLTSNTEFTRLDTNEKLAGTRSSNKYTLTNILRSGRDASTNEITPLTIEVTNVQLKSAKATEKEEFKLAVSDNAANIGEKNTIKSGTVTEIPSFYYDSKAPVGNTPVLMDNLDENSVGVAEADRKEFTNSEYVKATLQYAATDSGLYSITITSGAEFENSTEHPLSVKQGETELSFDISDDKKTLSFKKDGVNDAAVLLDNISSSIVLEINNLKLTQTNGADGVNQVEFKARSFGGKDSSANSKSITLDKTAPVWVGKGLYSKYDSRITSSTVWPHPVSNSYIYGESFGTDEDNLYFYKRGYINVGANVTDKNFANVKWKKTGGSASDYEYNYGDSSGEWTVFAFDKAGNKTSEKTLHIVDDTIFASNAVNSSVDNYMTLVLPEDDDTARIFRHTKAMKEKFDVNKYNYEKDGERANSSSEQTMNTHKYVIKQTTSPYYIKVKLGSGRNTSDLLLDGNKPAENDTYGFIEFLPDGTAKIREYTESTDQTSGNVVKTPKNPVSAAPIEYYSISHWYDTFSSGEEDDVDSHFRDSFGPHFPEAWTSEAKKKCKWHKYEKNSTRILDTDIYSYVDENGDIIIELPSNINCPPLAILFKDGCGNTSYRIVRPAGFADYQAVSWIVDGKLGTDEGYSGNATQSFNSSNVISYSEDKITYYKTASAGSLTIKSCSDTCRFEVYGTSSDADIAAGNYTMRCRIIAWNGSVAPKQEDFYEANNSFLNETTATKWYGTKESYPSSSNSSFIIGSINFPTPDVTSSYELWYIIEDTVGNFRTDQIKKNGYSNWLFDNKAPESKVTGVQKVNQAGEKNYYSSGSSVEYTIEDLQSGIKNDGDQEYDYSKRKSSIPGKSKSLENTFPDSDEALALENIEDFAGNKADNVSITYQLDENSPVVGKWVKQVRPTVSTNASETVAINPDDAGKNQVGNRTHNVWIDGQESISDGALTKIQAGSYNKNIPILLKPKTLKPKKNSSESDVEDTEPLLGWIMREEKLSNEGKNAFYDSSKDETKALLLKDAEGNIITGRNYAFTKTDNKNWPEKTFYFYAVNRAGLVSDKAIIIQFLPNIKPEILNKKIDYENIVSVDSENFIKSDSVITFKTNVAVSTCDIYMAEPNKDKYQAVVEDIHLTNISASSDTFEYKVSLDQTQLNGISGHKLKIRVCTAKNQSDDYELKGPANSNKWTLDTTPPVITLKEIKSANDSLSEPLTYSGSSTKFVESNKAYIYFTYDDENARWQYSVNPNAENPTWNSITAEKVVLDPENAETTTRKRITITLEEGETTYGFRAVDKAGNTSTVAKVALQKDINAPEYSGDKAFTVTVMKGNSIVTEGYINNITSSGHFKYDPDKVTKLKFTFTGYTDDGSGIDGIYINDVKKASFTKNTETKKYDATVELTLADYTNANILIKDKVGHNAVLAGITFIKDNTGPQLELARVQTGTGESANTIEAVSGVYYINKDNYYIYLSSAASDDDIAEIKAKITNTTTYADITYEKKDGFFVITMSAPEGEKSYTLIIKDDVGHEETLGPYKFNTDAEGPALKTDGKLEFTAKNGDYTAQIVDDTHKVADYIMSDDGSITYNPNKVSSLVFDDSDIEDSVSGYTAGNLWYKFGTGSQTQMTNKTVPLADTYNATDLKIYAKDNAGNTTKIKTYSLTTDGAAPTLKESFVNSTEDSANKIYGYTRYDGDTQVTKTSIVRDNEIADGYETIIYVAGTKLLYPKKDHLSGVKQFKFATVKQTSNEDGNRAYTASADNTDFSWTNMVTDSENKNYVFELPEITEPHSHLAIFFRDAVGNVSPAYYIGGLENNMWNRQWWIMEKALADTDISFYGDAWTNKDTSYEIKVKLPKGTVMRKVEAVNGTIEEVKLLYTRGGASADYTVGSGNYTNINYLYISGLSVKIRPSVDVNDEGNPGQEVSLKINGTEKVLFSASVGPAPAADYVAYDTILDNNAGTGFGKKIKKTKTSGEKTTARIVNFFSNIADVFARNSEVTVNKPAPEKAVKKENKKAAKKKSSKKAEAKAAIAVEAAEIVEETLNTPVPKLAAKAEVAVNSIVAVTEGAALEQEAAVADVSQTAPAAITEEEKSSSKTAVLVVMLAVLSAAGGAWYTLKRRKNR